MSRKSSFEMSEEVAEQFFDELVCLEENLNESLDERAFFNLVIEQGLNDLQYTPVEHIEEKLEQHRSNL